MKAAVIYNKVDGRHDPTCLVTGMGHLDLRMREIFPGKFWHGKADLVIQVSVQVYAVPVAEEYRSLKIGLLRCTDEAAVNRVLHGDELLTKLHNLALQTAKPFLYDLRTMAVVLDNQFAWSNGPDGRGPALFYSYVTGKIYCFDYPMWIANTCNAASKAFYPADELVGDTAVGRKLAAVLVGELLGSESPTAEELYWVTSVDMPRGNSVLKPDVIYPEGSLNHLRDFAARNKKKFTQDTEMDSPTSISLKDVMFTLGGIPQYFITESIANPKQDYTIVIDTMQDVIQSARLTNGILYLTLIASAEEATKVIARDSLGLFHVDVVNINYV